MNKNKKDQVEELDVLSSLQKAYREISELKNTISHKKISLEISRKIHKERKEKNMENIELNDKEYKMLEFLSSYINVSGCQKEVCDKQSTNVDESIFGRYDLKNICNDYKEANDLIYSLFEKNLVNIKSLASLSEKKEVLVYSNACKYLNSNSSKKS